MTIYQIDEFVICEYAAWDGDFTPPTTEWSPDGRQPSPTNGVIELPLYIRPGIGDGSNGKGPGITVSSPEDAVISLTVYVHRTAGITISSLESAVLGINIDLTHDAQIVLPSLENAIFELNLAQYYSLDIVIPSTENAILQLLAYLGSTVDVSIQSPVAGNVQIINTVNAHNDIVIPSLENAVLQLNNQSTCNTDIALSSPEYAEIYFQGNSTQNTDITLASPSNQSFILSNQFLSSCDIVLPSPEDAVLPLSFLSDLGIDLLNWNLRYEESLTDRIKCTSAVPKITFNIELLALLLLEDFLNKHFEYLDDAFNSADYSKANLGLIIREYLVTRDSHQVKWNGTKTLTDAFFIYEDIKLQFVKTINEALILTDSPSAMLELLLSEFILFTESITANWNTTRTVNDEMTLTDSIVQALQLFITESLVLTDAQVVQLQLELSEFVALAESATPNWNTTRTLTDTFDLKDFLYRQLTLVLTEALTVTDSAPLCQLGLAIYEYLGFTELLSAPGSFTQGVTDSLDATDSLNFGYSQVINDVLSLVSAADTVRLLLNTVSESLGLSETITGWLSSVLPISESLVLLDAVTNTGVLYNTIQDILALNLVIELDDEVWECYVLNTPKFMPSIYSGFNFNSYAVFDNRAYGCKSDGIYELIGTTDNGIAINTGVQFSETSFGVPNQKRFRKAYIGVIGSKPHLVTETEKGVTKVYTIDTEGEVDMLRTLRSKKWKLKVTDFSRLDFMKLIPVVLTK